MWLTNKDLYPPFACLLLLIHVSFAVVFRMFFSFELYCYFQYFERFSRTQLWYTALALNKHCPRQRSAWFSQLRSFVSPKNVYLRSNTYIAGSRYLIIWAILYSNGGSGQQIRILTGSDKNRHPELVCITTNFDHLQRKLNLTQRFPGQRSA